MAQDPATSHYGMGQIYQLRHIHTALVPNLQLSPGLYAATHTTGTSAVEALVNDGRIVKMHKHETIAACPYKPASAGHMSNSQASTFWQNVRQEDLA